MTPRVAQQCRPLSDLMLTSLSHTAPSMQDPYIPCYRYIALSACISGTNGLLRPTGF